MKEDDATEIPKQQCPKCGYPMDCTADVFGDHKPKPGDISMCLACGFLGVFDEQLITRVPSPEQQEKVLRSKRAFIAQLGRGIVVGDKITRRMKHDTNTKKTTKKTDV